MTRGGARHVVEAVGNQESMDPAIDVARRGGTVSFVGVPHNATTLPIESEFFKHVPLDRVSEGYPAMDERRAIKVILDVA